MSYQHISAKERHTLMYLLQMGLSYREICRRLGRHHTTISREINRNGRRFACYWNEYAEKQAATRKCKPRHNRKRSNDKLVTYVHQGLQEDWSPETIAGRLETDYPRSSSMRISPEYMYQWVYRNAMEGGLLFCLGYRTPNEVFFKHCSGALET